MKTITIISCFLIFFSCEKTNNGKKSDDYFYGYLRSSDENKNPLLQINTRYDECGEWGGHNETIILFAKDEKLKIFAKYEETKVDCESLGKFGEFNQKIIKNSTKEINEQQKTEIVNYLQKLVELKSKSFVIGNSGMSYSAISQDSTFTIYLYNNNPECKNAFIRLKNKLNF